MIWERRVHRCIHLTVKDLGLHGSQQRLMIFKLWNRYLWPKSTNHLSLNQASLEILNQTWNQAVHRYHWNSTISKWPNLVNEEVWIQQWCRDPANKRLLWETWVMELTNRRFKVYSTWVIHLKYQSIILADKMLKVQIKIKQIQTKRESNLK